MSTAVRARRRTTKQGQGTGGTRPADVLVALGPTGVLVKAMASGDFPLAQGVSARRQITRRDAPRAQSVGDGETPLMAATRVWVAGHGSPAPTPLAPAQSRADAPPMTTSRSAPRADA